MRFLLVDDGWVWVPETLIGLSYAFGRFGLASMDVKDVLELL